MALQRQNRADHAHTVAQINVDCLTSANAIVQKDQYASFHQVLSPT